MASKRLRRFVLDFDGTITNKDTISVIARSAISFQAEKAKDVSATWDGIVRDYARDYEEFVRAYRPVREDRGTVGAEVAFYRALRGVEERSFARVGERGLFAGIREREWERLGEEAVRGGEVGIRRGFAAFVEELSRDGGWWGVVSVNFSRAFIRGVLRSVGLQATEEVTVLANQPDEDGILRGPVLQDGRAAELMTTSDAKLDAMKALLVSWGEPIPNGVVYIGDSGTDLECLLEDGVVGIIMSEDHNSSLIQSMKRTGVEVLHIDEYHQKEKDTKGVAWARDFSEIIRSPLVR